MKTKRSGFTLLEILLVIGIIGILAAIVIIAINPGRSLAKSRDLQRKVGITEINKGLNQYYIDNGSYPSTITPELKNICVTGASATSTGIDCVGKIDLSMLVPTYLPSIPADPTGVGYKVSINSSRHVMLVASLTELGPPYIAIGTTTYVADICDGAPAVGTVCSDDTVYVSPTLRTTPSDAGSYIWGPNFNTTGATDVSDGRNNIAILKALNPDLSSYPAAQACNNSTAYGHSDWYWPAKDELNTLRLNKDAIGNLYGWIYWASTEISSTNAWIQVFNGAYEGEQWSNSKPPEYSVRCVRRP
ncbi:MAG: prepilin-type N-terminal cleavage/methylation domain-containing protein [bacterium]